MTKADRPKNGEGRTSPVRAAVHPSKLPKPLLETRAFASPRAFGSWVEKNHATSAGLWVKFAKKTSGVSSVTYAEALEVALCWGWIDGQSKRIDEIWYVQRFTPRAARSLWSRINCAKAGALIADLSMTALARRFAVIEAHPS